MQMVSVLLFHSNPDEPLFTEPVQTVVKAMVLAYVDLLSPREIKELGDVVSSSRAQASQF